MNCPEYYVLSNDALTIIHWQHADVRREYIGLREKLNPLRYEIRVGRYFWRLRFVINEDAWMWRKFINTRFQIMQKIKRAK